jgi:stage II sporulation protein D
LLRKGFLILSLPFVCGAISKTNSVKQNAKYSIKNTNILQKDSKNHKNTLMVKVRIHKNKREILLSGYNVSVGHNKQSFNFDKKKLLVRRSNNKILFKYEDNKNSEVFKILNSSKLQISGEFLRSKLRSLPKKVEIYINPKGRGLDLIVEVGIDEYLLGVLPSEMPASWPLEALKAQAVASRSYVLHKMKSSGKKHFHLESSTLDQVFRYRPQLGKVFEKKIKKAIQQTSGVLLVDSSEQVYKSYYHADCGGRTEGEFFVWKSGIKNKVVRDSFCPLSPQANWKHKISRRSLKYKMEKYLGEKIILQKILSQRKTPSGRQWMLRIGHYKNNPLKPVELSANQLREAVGYNKIKSAFFEFKRNRNQILFYGKGHGHGVGLCQWGTRALAKRGVGFEDILAHYYKEASLYSVISNKNKDAEKWALLW